MVSVGLDVNFLHFVYITQWNDKRNEPWDVRAEASKVRAQIETTKPVLVVEFSPNVTFNLKKWTVRKTLLIKV